MKVLLTTTSFQDTPGPHHDKLLDAGFELICERGPLPESKMLKLVGDVDAFLCGDDEITKSVIDKAIPRLKVISKYGIGLDKIDVDYVSEKGIPLTFCPGVNHTTVAEHTFALMLALFRKLVKEANHVSAGEWVRVTGNEIMGETIAIIGLGRIGREVAIRANAFGMKILGFDLYWDDEFAEKYPDNFYDVAIAEQHSMTFAAGLAKEGKKPVLAIYSTFLQRAYDQLIHDVALQKLDVTLAIDRAGFVGGDGATHAGIFDVAFLRCVPNMIIMSPSNEDECWKMLSTGYNYNGPAAIRYPRGEGPGEEIIKNSECLEIGRAKIVHENDSKIVIFSFGNTFDLAEEISNELDTSLVDMRFIKPLDENLIERFANKCDHIISIEENTISGGAGSAVNEFLSSIGFAKKLKIIGIPDEFPIVGDQADQREAAGLTKIKILQN